MQIHIQVDERLSDLEVFQSLNTLNSAIMRITDSMRWLVFFKLQAFFQWKIRSQNFSWKLLVSFCKPFKNLEKTSTPFFGFLLLNLFLGLFSNLLTAKKVLVPQVMCLASKIAFFFFCIGARRFLGWWRQFMIWIVNVLIRDEFHSYHY